MTMEKFVGSYKHDRDENLEEFFEKIGMNTMMRKMAVRSKPTMEVKVEGDEWTITTATIMKNVVSKFRLNEEVEVEAVKGKAKVVFTVEGNELIQKPSSRSEEQSRAMSVRTFTADGMIQMFKHIPSDTVAYRYFTRA